MALTRITGGKMLPFVGAVTKRKPFLRSKAIVGSEKVADQSISSLPLPKTADAAFNRGFLITSLLVSQLTMFTTLRLEYSEVYSWSTR